METKELNVTVIRRSKVDFMGNAISKCLRFYVEESVKLGEPIEVNIGGKAFICSPDGEVNLLLGFNGLSINL